TRNIGGCGRCVKETGHTITVNAAGNAENTVKNIAFNYIVRLA
ncbi:hypothetical protein ACKWMT_25655, partial [Escherichia coli]